ncbi:MAG: hypothetical protein R3F37_10680 [Candidatus Competibacteraceae bacterium]
MDRDYLDCGIPSAVAGRASAHIDHKIAQPDGSEFTVTNRGDEWNNWVETGEGYTVAPDNFPAIGGIT